MRDPVVGIDLGTTFSAVATIIDGRPRIVPNRDGRKLTPSMVGFPEGGGRVVGEAARTLAEDHPESVVFAAKRFIGRAYTDALAAEARGVVPYEIVPGPSGEARIRVGSRVVPVTQIAAMVLGELKADAEAHLGAKVRRAVITVPANFDDGQRNATKEAARIAGLEVLRLVNEPTAAAVAYGLSRDFRGRALVFDLGGGTFDVSILEVNDGVFEVKATGGDAHLGGEDFDDAIVEWLIAQLPDRARDLAKSDPLSRQRLRIAAERGKRALTSAEEAWVTIVGLGKRDGVKDAQGFDLDTALTREFFEQLSRPLSERCLAVCREVMDEAGLSPEALDAVLLVGGMTRVPLVRRLVTDFFGREPVSGVDPDEVVALGAAVQAEEIARQKGNALLIDVAAHSLGVGVLGGGVRRLIQKNTSIPVSVREVFFPGQAGQTQARIPILQGEAERQGGTYTLGELVLEDLQANGIRSASPIEVEFELAADATLSVRATDMRSGRARAIRIEAHTQLEPGEEERLAREEAAWAKRRAEADAAKEHETFERLLQKGERLVRILQKGAAESPSEAASQTIAAVKALVERGRTALHGRDAAAIADVRTRLATFV